MGTLDAVMLVTWRGGHMFGHRRQFPVLQEDGVRVVCARMLDRNSRQATRADSPRTRGGRGIYRIGQHR
jgi:hypothetical protein